MRRLATALAALALAVGLCVSPAHAIIYFPWTPPGATPQISRDGANYNSALETVLQMQTGHATAYLRAYLPDDIDKACDCSDYPHDQINDPDGFRWTIKRKSDNQVIASIYGKNTSYQFTQYGDYWITLAVNDAGLFADDPGGYLEQTPALAVHVMGLEIVAAHNYLVPGAGCNAVKYHVYPDSFDFGTQRTGYGRFEARDHWGTLRRYIRLHYEDAKGGEHTLYWDGKYGSGLPFMDGDDPVTYTVIVETDIGGDLTASLGGVLIEPWTYAVRVTDGSPVTSYWESGVDVATIGKHDPSWPPEVPDWVLAPPRLGVAVVVCSPEISMQYYRVEPAEAPPPQSAVLVWLSNRLAPDGLPIWYIFYTTPTNVSEQGIPLGPIKYHLRVSGDVTDRADNLWDMNPTTEVRDAEWNTTFQVSPSGQIIPE